MSLARRLAILLCLTVLASNRLVVNCESIIGGLLHRATHSSLPRAPAAPADPATHHLPARVWPPIDVSSKSTADDCPNKPLPFATLMADRTKMVPWQGLTQRMLMQSRANVGSNHRLQRAISKLQQGQGVRIAVLGGSVAFGFGCEGSSSNQQALERGQAKPWDCAWAAKLEEWLHAAYPATRRELIQVVNLAKPSTTSQWAATFLGNYAEHLGHPLSEFDIFLVDYEINDERAGPLEDVKKIIPPSVEELLIRLLSLPQQPAIVQLFTGTLEMNGMFDLKGRDDPNYFIARPWIEDEELKVLRYYQVPAISWRDALWPNAFLPDGKRNPLLACQDNKHPSVCLHFVWAALVANLLLEEISLYCREENQKLDAGGATGSSAALWQVPTFQSPRDELPIKKLFKGAFKEAEGEVFSAVLTTLTVDGGKDRFMPTEIRPAGSWQFREDVPGKPGWIVEGPGGGEEISFDVLFSRRIVLGFMSSYENMAQVQVFMDKLQPAPGVAAPSGHVAQPGQLVVLKRAPTPATIVDSLWRNQVSQYAQKTVVYLPTAKKPPIWMRIRIQRIDPKKVRSNRTPPSGRGRNKFKLLAVLSY